MPTGRTGTGERGGLTLSSHTDVRIRSGEAADRVAVETFLDRHEMRTAARGGELLTVADHPVLLAERGAGIVGVLAYIVHDEATEVLALYVDERWTGVGSALLDALESLASARGSSRLWLITTNDNVDALRFYQRRGFRLAAIDRGAVDRSRANLKPGIPRTGLHGIRIRDELTLERLVARDGRRPS